MTTKYVYPLILSGWSTGDAAPASFFWEGGKGLFLFQGTVGTAKAQLQIIGPDGVNYLNVGSEVSAEGITEFNSPPGTMKLVMSGTGGSGLYAKVIPSY